MIEAHIAKDGKQTGQFHIPRDKAEVRRVVVRDTGQAIDVPRHTLRDGPLGTYIELAEPASEYIMLTVVDRTQPEQRPGSRLKEWQQQQAALHGSGAAPFSPPSQNGE